MLCSSKTNHRPDQALRRKLVCLSYSLLALAAAVILFMVYPDYFTVLILVMLFLISLCLILTIQTIYSGEEAMSYGGFANEMIRRKAVAELVSCLQAEPYNLTAAEAKKAIKEATPINGRQIDKDLSIEKNLNEGLKDLLDRGFVLRSEAESFLRMTPEEQRIAAQMLQQLYAIAYNGPGSAAIQDEKKAIRGRFVDALRTVADTSSMQDAHEALVAAVFTVQKEMACLKETIRKVKTIPPEQPAAQVEQTEVIREVREKTAGAKAQSKITGKLSSQTSRLETMLRRKNPEKRLAEKYTHEERRQAMKELDEMIATATRLREIIAKVERSADEAQEV